MGSKPEEGVSFETIYGDERKLIEEERKRSQIEKPPEELVGLALSGGGIRSATFNLGVLQGLAELGLLKKFDYLSTVSGGGYIGSWLSALINREGKGNVGRIEPEIAPKTKDEAHPEHAAVTFLRNYSNYLTPRASLFSNDTLTAVTTYLRNLFLNQGIVILALAVVLLAPRLIQSLGDALLQGWRHFLVSAALLVIGVGAIGYNLGFTKRHGQPAEHRPWWTGTVGIIGIIVIPVIAAAWIDSFYLLEFAADLKGQFAELFFGTGAFYLLLWIVGYGFSLYSERQAEGAGAASAGLESLWAKGRILETLKMALFTFLAGAAGGVLFWVLAYLIEKYLEGDAKPWLGAVLGAPVVVDVFSLIVVVHIGLMGRLFSEDQREWWSRLGALLLGAMLIWLGIFGVAVLGPSLLIGANRYVMALLGSGWVITTLGGVLAGKSANTGGENPKPWLDLLARYAPYIFIVGLLAVISLVIQAALSVLGGGAAGNAEPCQGFYCILQQQSKMMSAVKPDLLVWNTALLAGIACLLAWRVNVNLFSLHQFYRYRLTRAYLGATNTKRNAHPFTGFDKDDDLNLSKLNQRPYPIINTAINFTDGGELAWQDRKATSFVFTPKYSGYQIPDPKAPHDPTKDRCYYRPTEEYAKTAIEEMSLGRAMAISGAAASPNMGYHTSPAAAFLLTVFNVRLGRWCGNPKHPRAWKKPDPGFGLWYLISELLGFSSLDSHFVSLSDGGHFENTAIYELVRRKCRRIVVCDAGADPDVTFEDLGNAVRKCRADFGVEISIDLAPLQPVGEIKHSARHYAEGTIDYGSYAPGIVGKLIVLKPSLSLQRDEPADILNYADSHPDFPQQPTTDQWFDEAQFESYRKLGYYAVVGGQGKAGEVLHDLMP